MRALRLFELPPQPAAAEADLPMEFTALQARLDAMDMRLRRTRMVGLSRSYLVLSTPAFQRVFQDLDEVRAWLAPKGEGDG